MNEIGLEAGIVTSDAEGLRTFYVSGLGFVVERVLTFPQGEVNRLVRGRAMLKLFQPAHRPQPNPTREVWSERAGFAYAALHVDDVGREVERAVGAGATVLVGVTNHRPGALFAMIADPEGNVWELLQEHGDEHGSG